MRPGTGAGKIVRFVRRSIPGTDPSAMHVPADSATRPTWPHLARQYWLLTKPRVTQLAIFCAVIGMFLASPELPNLAAVALATAGIWLLAGAAFAVNSIIERTIDAKMARTRMRPVARGEITPLQAVVFSGAIGGAGMWLLYTQVNALTMWLTFATFVGYAVIYTVLLKPNTPQNIVIGGISGAMPPVLGWAAMTGDAPAQAWLLALIIFRLDAAALLVAGAVPPRRLSQVRPADAARDARRTLHAAAHPAVHGDPGRHDDAALLRSRWPGCSYLACRAGAWRRVSSPTRGGSIAATAIAWRARPSTTRSSIWRRCLRRCWSTTTSR